MTEDKNSVKNGAANAEMAPQEDGSKVPLTNDGPEVKFTSNDPPNGDAKIDMPLAPTFSGLTKEELMKYSNDPFWVRLRWVLFILFWLGWVAMLVVAIVIIIQAPRCAPKETLEWVQESAMIEYDVENPIDVDSTDGATPMDMVTMAKELGVTTIYLQDLINPNDFETLNPKYTKEDVMGLLEAAENGGLRIVTDSVPSQVGPDNNWFKNPNMSDYFKPNSGGVLDFSNQELVQTLTELLSGNWKEKGVAGFLLESADTEELVNASQAINEALKPNDGAFVHGVADMASELVSGFNAKRFRSFLQEHIDDWTYYKFNPRVAAGSIPTDVVRLVTLSLFLVPGTPILHGFDKPYFDEQKEFIKALSELREKESVKVGNMTFVEGDENVVAYARVMKGTPGYAVAVNLHDTNNATVDFTTIAGVSGKGDNSLRSTSEVPVSSLDLGRSDMSSVFLEPYEGIVIQFVPNL
ncbi:amino acid transporter heavy chain SLC3A2 [Procambarus clarkii]|uniref:amino acid transporter heavy chain SLC3A2 n=1 Tax=Procambarus clarkii TaxID=6728 RepID=UPI003741FB72